MSGIIAILFGEMPERLNGAVSKTVIGLVPIVGSNPTLSADFFNTCLPDTTSTNFPLMNSQVNT